jgi:hypothetical protein
MHFYVNKKVIALNILALISSDYLEALCGQRMCVRKRIVERNVLRNI